MSLDGLEKPIIGNHAHSKVRREIARSYKRQGLSNIEIGKFLGVTAQHVSYMLNEMRRRRGQLLRNAKKRRAANQRRYTCGVCGERGHNARRHTNYRPEDFRTG